MRKYALLLLAFVLIFAATTAKAAYVMLDMDVPPDQEGWDEWICPGAEDYQSWVEDGVFIIDTTSCIHYTAPYDLWNETVDNATGWVIETRLKIGSETEALPDWVYWPNVGLWIYDYAVFIMVGFEKDHVFISYRGYDGENYDDIKERWDMDTTDDFHVYRIHVKGDTLKLFVDDDLVKQIEGIQLAGASQNLHFGDIGHDADSTSYWDYFLFDTSWDSDGDGVPDDLDACPDENASGFDADGDGCIDTFEGLIDVLNNLVAQGVISEQLQNSLTHKILNAWASSDRDSICAAVNELGAFKNQIEAQRGKKISDEAADLLIAYADNLIEKLLEGLPPGDSC